MKFFSIDRLGPLQSMTPEGFLVCESVPVCRTGSMLYGPGEVPVTPGPDGFIRIEREEDEVFRPETVASAAGKSICITHPNEDVTPQNWRELSVGVMLHPRRGQGVEDDVLLADLLVTDYEAIKAVRENRMREVSCGYDADYEEIAPGRGRQKNIVINHLALVENGRCGPRCAIGDQQTQQLTDAEEPMKKTWKDRIKDAFSKKDESALTAVLDEVNDSEDGKTAVHVHVGTRDGTCDQPPEKDPDDDKREKARDAAIDARFAAQDKKITDLATDVKAIKDAVLDASDPDDDEDEDEDDERNRRNRDEKVEGNLEMEVPPGATHDSIRSMKDSHMLEESYRETVALAESILPGVKIPTFDAKANPKQTVKRFCAFRRRVLDQAYNLQTETHDFMDEMMQGKSLGNYTCDGVRTVFQAVGIFKKNQNRKSTQDFVPMAAGGTGVRSTLKTPADMNKALKEFYSKARA